MTTRAVLGRPDLLRLAAGGLISEVGDWMLLVAFPLFVLELTGSPLVTSTVFVLQMVPSVVAGPLAGVLIDRVDRWRLMAVVALLQAAILSPLLAVTSADELGVVYLVVAAQSVLGTIIEPCRATTAAALAPAEDLMAVNQTLGVASNLARLVGGPLGGLALGLGGIGTVLVAAGAAFVLSAVLFGTRRRVGSDPTPGTNHGDHALRELFDGLRLVVQAPVLRRLMGVAGCMALAQGGFVILFVLFVIRDLNGAESEVGILRGIQAVGALAGGLLLALVVRRVRAHHLVAGSLAMFGVLSLAVWNLPHVTTSFGVYVALFIVVGAPGLAAMTGLLTIVQTHAPEAARGRVVSTFFAALTGVQAVGMLAGGLVGTGMGLTVALQVQGVLYLVAGALALRLRPTVLSDSARADSAVVRDGSAAPGS
ncbi:MFS transporter [Mumia sp. zg.B53]|uniref:MFS transporter n=1 Tax=Mumia sp. zg.B53 TaxID=2855449 RepID=UPI001C6F0BF9|nr:MFS transporter [Mumia sp. zg.B53]MBW9214920.1 MFS transporter [Mumia sp. zg.B53]